LRQIYGSFGPIHLELLEEISFSGSRWLLPFFGQVKLSHCLHLLEKKNSFVTPKNIE